MDERFLLIRPADLATLLFALDNLVLDGQRFRRAAAGAPAGFTVVLPPQHFRENVTVPFAAPPQLAAAGDTSLEFRLADEIDSVEVGDGGLLALCERLRATSVIALPAGAELFPLDGRWRWGSEPELLNGRGALWRAKLDGPRPNGAPRARFQLSRAAEPAHAEWDFLPSMAQLRERQSGVMEAKRFDFSPIGASVRMQGPVDFGNNPMTPERQALLGSYQHDVDFGRDSRVQVVSRGHLSSGHPASLIQLRRRVFTRNPDAEFGEHEAVAELQTLDTIVVADPILEVGQLAEAYGGPARDMPFRTLRLLTTYLTELDPVAGGGLEPFWVEARGLPVPFALQGVDWAGNVVDFAMPLIFIPDGRPFDEAAFAAKGGLERCRAGVGSRSIALLAPETAAAREAAPLTVESIVLGVQNAVPGHTGSPVLPVLSSLRVVVDAVTHFTGVRTPVETTWHQAYRSSGLDGPANRLGTYLTLPSPLPVDFGDPRRVGGLARPDMQVAALSVVNGALPAGFDTGGAPDIDTIKEQFGTAKVLGMIALTDVVDFDTFGPPELTEKVTAEQAELRYAFVAAIKDQEKGNTSVLQPAGVSSLRLTATVVRRFADGATSTSMSGFLTNVAITVADVAILGFTSLNFRADPGTTPTIDPQGLSLRFAGDLDFLQTLSEALEDLGLGGARRPGRHGPDHGRLRGHTARPADGHVLLDQPGRQRGAHPAVQR